MNTEENHNRDNYPKMGKQLIQYLETMCPREIPSVKRKTARR